MKYTHEIRYVSESFGTLALFGRYASEHAANAALIAMRLRASAHGAGRVAKTAHVRLRSAR